MRNQLFSLLAVAVLLAATTSNATAQSRTSWEMHKGLEVGPYAAPYDDIVLWGYTMPSHGNVAEYGYAAAIPDANDTGWGPAPNGDTIGFSIYSRLCGRAACRQGGDFTYFQTFVNVPANVTVTAFTIAFSGMDDGSRVSIVNSSYPAGLVIPGSYVFLGGSGTTNLAPYVVSGETNRVIITQVDDCCSGNNLHSAKVILNGNTVVTNPDSDGDGVPDDDDACPGFDDYADADQDGVADGCDACPLDYYGDSDGDGSCDSDDACPGFDDNADADQDGTADGCDACPLDFYNDSDGDGLCDSDDNCVADANADQADFDGDGFGDACDDDADDDGVDDDLDECHFTALGEIVLPDGCSIDQTCACDADWKNHGQYVSCVAHACNVLVAADLITGEEHGIIVSAAAHSDCGVKEKGKK